MYGLMNLLVYYIKCIFYWGLLLKKNLKVIVLGGNKGGLKGLKREKVLRDLRI